MGLLGVYMDTHNTTGSSGHSALTQYNSAKTTAAGGPALVAHFTAPFDVDTRHTTRSRPKPEAWAHNPENGF